MELKKMIKDLIDSGITENQELGLALLAAPDISEEEKRKYIEKFILDWKTGLVDFTTKEQENIFRGWYDIYNSYIKEEIKKRVKRI